MKLPALYKGEQFITIVRQIIIVYLSFIPTILQAQCPVNIDFEKGDFSGWQCYTGNVAAVGGQNIITLNASAPLSNRHDILSFFPGNGVDPFGGFPQNCPNGSGQSIKLGNTGGGNEAEGISYVFTIPANRNEYNLIYHYAVVFQDPNHRQEEQPRMEIEIINITDGSRIDCSSFSFFPYGTPLPGFQLSPNPGGNTPVWYKDWTAVSVNLDGLAGKQIQVFFKTADCTFRRHFGYAYIDINTECSSQLEGASFCPDDSIVNIIAPYGYQSYTWHDDIFTQILGTNQVLTFAPPPSTTTNVAVVVTPYNGYGCIDTLYAEVKNNLVITANAGKDTVSCNKTPVPIGSPPQQNVTYKWTPNTGLTNPNMANPLAFPDVTTIYALEARSKGGGCLTLDTVVVKAINTDNSLTFLGKEIFCIGSGDSAVLIVRKTDSVQWFKNGNAIIGAVDTIYKVTESGIYYAQLFGEANCIVTTQPKTIGITSVPISNFDINNSKQCLNTNVFKFTNRSTNNVGQMEYRWVFGDGNESFNKDIIYSYKKAGEYLVKLYVSSSDVCIDSFSLPISVYQNAIASYDVLPTCINKPVTIVNNTTEIANDFITYLWTFSDGSTSTLRNPPLPIYTNAGPYNIILQVTSTRCPLPGHSLKKVITIDKPTAAINYPLEYAIANLPIDLHARTFGQQVLWKPSLNLNDASSTNPIFISNVEQLYTIEITTKAGCITIDTQMVKLASSIQLYVPNAFTPNGDGVNDVLKPISFGIKKINYFKVFNRFGQIVYQTNTLKQGWDGVFKNESVSSQSFVWMIEGVGFDNKIYFKKGNSILIR